ncbi:MAG: hypothetical protein AAF386_13135, partial [Pseudomonadota bacterium]
MTPTDDEIWRRYRRRKGVLWAIWDGPAAFVAACVLCLVLTIVVFQNRTVPVPGILTDTVAQRLDDMAGANSLTFQSADIGLSDGLHPRVVLRGASLKNPDGDLILDVASVDLTLDFEGLIFGKAQPRNIYFSGGLIDLERSRDGAYDLGLQSDQVSVQTPDLASLVGQVSGALANPAIEKLASAQIDGLTVRYEDNKSNRIWTFDGGRFSLTRPATGGLNARLDLAVLTGQGDPATLAIGFDQTATGTSSVTADLDGILSQDLAEQSQALGWLSLVDAPLSGSLRAQLDNGVADVLNATLDFGQGRIQV